MEHTSLSCCQLTRPSTTQGNSRHCNPQARFLPPTEPETPISVPVNAKLFLNEEAD